MTSEVLSLVKHTIVVVMHLLLYRRTPFIRTKSTRHIHLLVISLVVTLLALFLSCLSLLLVAVLHLLVLGVQANIGVLWLLLSRLLVATLSL